MNCDKHMPLHDSGIYSSGTGTSAWRDVSPDQMRGMLQGENPPAFRTALAKTGEDEFGGPWYLDIDSEDIGESIRSVQALLDRFVSIGLDLSCVRIFATGKKGFHIEVPAACIMLEPGPVVGLPRIYRAMALEVFVDGLDMRVYSAGRGRLWRVPNLLRENGAYKVPVTADEVRAMTMESYAELCGVPRPFPPLSAPKYCPRLAALFDKACQRLAVTTSRTRTWTRAEAELRERFSGACPPSLAPILTGRLPSPLGFNLLAIQVCLLAHALDWDEERLIDECAGLIEAHEGDGGRYDSPRKRENELRRMFAYCDGSRDYSFSVAGVRSMLPCGTPSYDLNGLAADEGEGMPCYADLIDSAEDASAVLAVARQVQADTSLSRTEAAQLLKRVAKSAGVSLATVRADLYDPDDSGLAVDVVRHDFSRSVDSAMQILGSIPSLRTRGGGLVEVMGSVTVPVQLPRLAYLISQAARWRYPEGIGAPDVAVLQAVLGAGRWPNVPELLGVTSSPTLLEDGRIGSLPGYDPQFDAADFPAYAGSGAQALKELRVLLHEFPFADAASESAALAAILTAVSRPTLRTAPAFIVTAHDLGSGKSTLAELIALFAAPDVEMGRWAQRAEEQDKTLLSLLRESRPVCVFDNLVKDWCSPTLAAILTAPTYSDRLLGSSETVSVSTRVLFVATGNNVKAGADLSRRVVPIELDPRCENPLTRKFSGDPVGEVRRNRARWVMVALKALQAFVQDGMANPDLTPLASFPEWSRLIRGALHWYGLPDIIDKVIAQVEGDDEREALALILEVWHELFGDEPMTLKEVIAASYGTATGGDLQALFQEIAGERGAPCDINLRKLGGWLREHAGRVTGGKRLVKGQKTRAGSLWRVVQGSA